MKNVLVLAEFRKHVIADLSRAEIMKTMKISTAKFWELYSILTQQDGVVYKTNFVNTSLRPLKVSSSGFTITVARLKSLGLADKFSKDTLLTTVNDHGKLTLSVVSAG